MCKILAFLYGIKKPKFYTPIPESLVIGKPGDLAGLTPPSLDLHDGFQTRSCACWIENEPRITKMLSKIHKE